MMDETPLRRSIIRHMFLIIDLSDSMRDRDFRPNRSAVASSEHIWHLASNSRRFELTLQYVRTYVVEWFDQNPLGQVGVNLLRDRLSETLIPMGGELFQRSSCARTALISLRQPAGDPVCPQ